MTASNQASQDNSRANQYSLSPAATARLDAYMQQRLQEGIGPGIAVALTDRESLLYVGCYGLADIVSRVPVTPDTLFQTGSIGKSFTALAILRQYEAGKLNLHAPVTAYLPWFEVQSEYEPITLHHLLSHTAGIVMGSDIIPASAYKVWNLRNTTTSYPPGTDFHYSNVGYVTLGRVLAVVTGQSYSEVIRTSVFEPLGMTASAPVITYDDFPRMALGHLPGYRDDQPTNPTVPAFPATWFEYTDGDGGQACTPADLAAYTRMLLNGGQGLITPETFALMTTPVIDTRWGYDYGYGLFLSQTEDGHTMVEHAGEMIGYHAIMQADMTDGLGVVLMINGIEEGSELASFALKVLQADRQGQELPPLPPAPTNQVANIADYVGRYEGEGTTLNFIEQNGELVLEYQGQQLILEKRYPDIFYSSHPDFKSFFFGFQRENDQIVQVVNGPKWYRSQHYTGPTEFTLPADLQAYIGHYRSYSPWESNFRVFARKGQLLMQVNGFNNQPLTLLDTPHTFRAGAWEKSPERLRFECFVDGQPLRANYSGGEFYRVDTP